jgi:choline dehydrogenase-like flavoprotein
MICLHTVGMGRYGQVFHHTSGQVLVSDQTIFPRKFHSANTHRTALFRKGFNELGVPSVKEHANGHAVNLFWVPNSLDPKNETRSYARTAHYDPVKSRANYHLLVNHYVDKVTFAKGSTVANGVIIRSVDNSTTLTATAKKEVILAAGALTTPRILQRSGIGPTKLLREARIDVKVKLEGVGANFQDHPTGFVIYSRKVSNLRIITSTKLIDSQQ